MQSVNVSSANNQFPQPGIGYPQPPSPGTLAGHTVNQHPPAPEYYPANPPSFHRSPDILGRKIGFVDQPTEFSPDMEKPVPVEEPKNYYKDESTIVAAAREGNTPYLRQYFATNPNAINQVHQIWLVRNNQQLKSDLKWNRVSLGDVQTEASPLATAIIAGKTDTARYLIEEAGIDVNQEFKTPIPAKIKPKDESMDGMAKAFMRGHINNTCNINQSPKRQAMTCLSQIAADLLYPNKYFSMDMENIEEIFQRLLDKGADPFKNSSEVEFHNWTNMGTGKVTVKEERTTGLSTVEYLLKAYETQITKRPLVLNLIGRVFGHPSHKQAALDQCFKLLSSKKVYTEILNIFSRNGMDLNATDNKGSSGLHMETSCLNSQHVNWLIQHGANTGQLNRKGQSILHILAELKPQQNNSEMKSVQAVLERWIAEGRIDVNIINPNTGESALFKAIKTGNLDFVSFLINMGADPRADRHDVEETTHTRQAYKHYRFCGIGFGETRHRTIENKTKTTKCAWDIMNDEQRKQYVEKPRQVPPLGAPAPYGGSTWLSGAYGGKEASGQPLPTPEYGSLYSQSQEPSAPSFS